MRRLNTKGFSIVEFGLLIVTIVLLVAIGTYAIHRQQQNTQNNQTATTTSGQTASASTPTPQNVTVRSTNDLDKADKSLNVGDTSTEDQKQMANLLNF